MLSSEGIFAWNQLQPSMTGEDKYLFHLENVKKVYFPNLVYISSRKFRAFNVCHDVRIFPMPICNIKIGKAPRQEKYPLLLLLLWWLPWYWGN